MSIKNQLAEEIAKLFWPCANTREALEKFGDFSEEEQKAYLSKYLLAKTNDMKQRVILEIMGYKIPRIYEGKYVHDE